MEDAEVGEIPLPTPDVFPFPYPTPYSIQVDLMRTVFEAIEQKKIAIVCPHFAIDLSLSDAIGRITDWYWKKSHIIDIDSDLVGAESKEGG